MKQYLELFTQKSLTNYQEYIDNDYCIVCTYFKPTKGHFGYCTDLLNGKVYDGTKKGTGCPLWRLQTAIYSKGIKQVLPAIPTLKYNFKNCRVRRKNHMAQFKKPRVTIPRKAVKCRVCPAMFIWSPHRQNQDLCNHHTKSFEMIRKQQNISQIMNNYVRPLEVPIDYCI
jgi:hypothetical protein